MINTLKKRFESMVPYHDYYASFAEKKIFFDKNLHFWQEEKKYSIKTDKK